MKNSVLFVISVRKMELATVLRNRYCAAQRKRSVPRNWKIHRETCHSWGLLTGHPVLPGIETKSTNHQDHLVDDGGCFGSVFLGCMIRYIDFHFDSSKTISRLVFGMLRSKQLTISIRRITMRYIGKV